MPGAAYIMVGGFLGAGKTTAILALAQHLRGKSLRVGLITNDQSFGLVDTAFLSSQGFPVEEITGGCFCCRFNSLIEASERLTEQTRPDVFVAEPVGSCTDLRATVSYPLQRIYGDNFQVAPFSVMLDPIRALRILGIEPGRAFSSKVLYVYQKQLEEADVIVINKCDLLSPERLQILRDALQKRFPKTELMAVSAREGTGLEHWFKRIVGTEMGAIRAPDVDYDLYAEGEALLGWLNSAVRLDSESGFDGNEFLQILVQGIRERLGTLEIAHLKMTLVPDEEGDVGGDIGVLNLVRTDGRAELSHTLKEPLHSGQLLINLRAEGDPEILRGAVAEALQVTADAKALRALVDHMEHFRPGRPVPTHRIAVPAMTESA